jgi:hypothetical protein
MNKHASIVAAILLLGTGFAASAAEEQRDRAASERVEKSEPNGAASRQIESGARQIGRGVQEAAKGVAEGTKEVGRKIGGAAREAEPEAKSAWENLKTAAADAGRSVKTFFSRLFGG